MDHDDDVEHLFSWLQTPELRYREFAGAREITDAVIISQAPASAAETPVPPAENTQLQEEYPPDPFPDQRDAPADVVVRAPERTPPTAERAAIAPTPAASPAAPPMPRAPAPQAPGPFELGAGGRGGLRRPQYEEPVVPPPVETTPAPPAAAAQPAAGPAAVALPSAATPRPAPPGGGLLGGAYRENGLNGHGGTPEPSIAPAEPHARVKHSLDAVFGRLAGARDRLPDPRERLRHIPGLGPPPNRSR